MPTDKCGAHHASKKTLGEINGDYYRDAQLACVQRINYCEVPNPNWHLDNTTSVPKAQGKLWPRRKKDYNSQRTRFPSVIQCLLDLTRKLY